MLSLPLAAMEGTEDRAAFLRFYDAHAQGLLRYARSLLREPALAEEAVQEAWLRCIRSAAAFLALPESYREVERIDLGALVSVLYDGPGGTLELSWDGQPLGYELFSSPEDMAAFRDAASAALPR